MKDQWLPYPRYLLRKNLIKKILHKEILKGKNCLEIGYGPGDMLLLFAKTGMKTYGFDFSEMAYENAFQRINNNLMSRDQVVLFRDANEMEKHKYDYVMAFEVLEHIDDHLKTLKEWRSYLKSDGMIILSVPAHKNKWGNNDMTAGHYRRYEKEELEDLFLKSGIDIHFLWCYGFPLTLLLDPILNMSKKEEVEKADLQDKEHLSKTSGVIRPGSLLVKLLSNDLTLLPFYWMQQLFLNKDIGSGYIIAGTRRN